MTNLHKRCSRALFLLLVVFASASISVGQEVELTSEEYARLDSFEQQILKRADKVFAEALEVDGQASYLKRINRQSEAAEKQDDANRRFRRAAVEYDSFILEFPRSSAIPYSLLRKARSLQLADKRFQAIKEYQEILDFFPNDVKFAAAALFYKGQAYWQDGDVTQAMRAWKEMADDKDYSKHFLAASAINQLADNYIKQDQEEKAIEYYMQAAIDFRQSNADAARAAMYKVIPFYIRTRPDEAKLRDFYGKVQTFHHHPRKAPEDLNTNAEYWSFIRQYVRDNGNFNELQVDMRRRHFSYWANAMDGRLADNDDYQIDRIAFLRAAEGDTARWISRLDKQFEQYQKEGDYDRVVKWIRAYAGQKEKVQEYYQKLNFPKMSNDAIYGLTRTFIEQVRDMEMARNVVTKVNWDKATDEWLWNPMVYQLRQFRDDEIIEELCRHFADAERGKIELLRYHYHYTGNRTKGMPLAEELASSTKYADEAWYYRGIFLMRENKFEEAIKCFQQADKYSPPQSKWQVAECHRKLGRLSAAIAELKEIENFFKDHSANARWHQAIYYRDAGDQKQFIANLRAILKQYPKSGQASSAHQELEKLGVKIGGGVDADVE